MLLLLVCSLTVWLWARYIIRLKAQDLIRRDVRHLSSEVVWQPQLGAFELRSPPNALLNTLGAHYWQISDPKGRIIWKSEMT